MPKKLQKTLQDYLNKIKNKKPHPQITLTKMLSGCKHPKTPSFSLDNGRNMSSSNAVNNKINDAATLADVDRFLFENFKSLYFKDDEETENNNANTNTNNNNNNKRISDGRNNEEPLKLGSWLFESPRFITTPPQDLCGSARFFVKPGNSGSLMEDALSLSNSDEADSSNSNSSSTASPTKEVIMVNHVHDHHDRDHNNALPDNCVALLSYSPSPYDDFRRSMQELVESKFGKIENNQRIIDWDFMEEILFSYLNVNEKKSHKFILSAFVDLITVMRRNSEAAPGKPCSVRTVRIGREVRKKKTKQVTIEFESS
ncbi:hypothetical protein L195_g005022 [Trifolium pratense]|uniref:Uncharacterized protein n=2 Tax=Trifolium pratense TaxID=57577 RepID=A0ACB0KVS7_TRIPR|nr:transcription repressor OFP14 [Trifolium pratense]PNY08496.1 hypothetical protein L195_g005022 [Trifolium pratense]CAJ2661267.1 unnamed protein product [Trifolium pratense]